MKPIGDCIFAKKVISENKTESGIIIPESVKKQNIYEVLSIGDRVKHIKIGDRVKKFNGALRPKIDFDGTNVEVLRESGDIEFIIKKSEL